MTAPVLLLATLETKENEANFFTRALEKRGIKVDLRDVSLGSDGQQWHSDRKLAAVDLVASTAGNRILKEGNHLSSIIVGIGGGLGGDIVLRTMHMLPFNLPKVLVTTLPFDPREAVADNSIILVPTLADIEGLNPSLRRVLESTAAMIAGLCRESFNPMRIEPSVGMTTLGVTKAASDLMIAGFRRRGYETTPFHANGYGGAAFSRFAKSGAFLGVVDMTVHEITRIKVAGSNVDMPDRFTCASRLPRVVLPGGLNFIGLGPLNQVPSQFLDRPRYLHSSFFTHVKMMPNEMERVCGALANDLNQSRANTTFILPMGGFSSEDRPGGAIEDLALREVAANFLEREAVGFETVRVDQHIAAPETAALTIEIFLRNLSQEGRADD